ncbi:hypothetical protein GOB94_08990 [Granulicella sp. 5B5]|uniref:ATP-binding protein n=1 Tax=Granulicella sp. 5B5 TaxID=1617967 RepID=UPI0015F458D3|nr:ATP-binding protein [Granulicella sp. 5B5]QMV18801.1 hypothetical protein GOB94_08990 [Granulicella sp. 5B5]
MEETWALEQMLFNTLNQNPQHFILHGERGIGKSSLLQIHRMLAVGQISGNSDKANNFLVVTLNLEPTDTHESLIRKLGLSLQTTCAAASKGNEVLKKSLDFLLRFEAAGVKLRDKPARQVVDPLLELTNAYCQTVEDIKGFRDGILVIIDEADTAPASAHLGATLKSLSERVALSSNNVLCFGLAGVSNLISTLRESHESSPRLFTGFDLKPLSESESHDVVKKSIADANQKNLRATKILPDAEDMIVALSEGYPSFIQEFGYFAFDADEDFKITVDDVKKGAWQEHGAYAQLGMKYFHHLYNGKIGSDEYRNVLHFMSTHSDKWVSKEQIRQGTRLKETTLSNAMQALVSRGIVNRDNKKGYYRLPSKSFAAWIKGELQKKNGGDTNNTADA